MPHALCSCLWLLHLTARCLLGGAWGGGAPPPANDMHGLEPWAVPYALCAACGSPIEKQGVRSGGRGGAEPPHQRMSNPCVEGSTVSVEQGPFAHRVLIQGMLKS